MNNRKLASAAAVLLLGGAALLWLAETRSNMVAPGSRITVVGNLPPRDVAEIRRAVRREAWRGVFPRFSWQYIRSLPGMIRYRASVASLPILGIIVNDDGTVQVETGAKVRELPIEAGRHLRGDFTYKLKKGQQGWQIIGISSYDFHVGCEG